MNITSALVTRTIISEIPFEYRNVTGVMIMSSTILQELNPLFYPQSIAVVGASPKDDPLMMNQGNNYIKGSVSLNYKGKIYPVHPNAENIMGS